MRSVSINAYIHFELVCVKSMEIDLHWFNTHELKMDMFWILSSCVLNQWIDLHWFNTHELKMDMFLQFGYATFMVEIFYVRWSVLDQSLHWDLFMRDIIRYKIIIVGVNVGSKHSYIHTHYLRGRLILLMPRSHIHVLETTYVNKRNLRQYRKLTH